MTEPQQPPQGHGPPPAYEPTWQGYGQPSGYGPGAPAGWSGGPPAGRPQGTEPKAVVALVLAIAAYTPVVPFIGAIAALVLVRMARRDIARSGGTLGGLGLCRAASILSWVHLVFVGLFLLVVLALLVGGVGIGFL